MVVVVVVVGGRGTEANLNNHLLKHVPVAKSKQHEKVFVLNLTS